MDTNGLSLYNVGTSLDLDALTGGGTQGKNNDSEGDDTDDGEEDEIQQRNAELRDLLTNAFDDLIEEETDLEVTYPHSSEISLENQGVTLDHLKAKDIPGYLKSSLYSPVNEGHESLSETQYHDTESCNPNNGLNSDSWVKEGLKKSNVKFSPLQNNKSNKSQQWGKSKDESEKHFLASGLNSQAELEILYAARGSEISNLTDELHQLNHKVALLEGEKIGLKATLEASESLLKETREENRRLKQEIEILNQRVKQMGDNNDDLASKLEASENNIISLERQLLDINLLQAHQREENRQDLLLSGVKTRYEKDLRTLRDELNRLRLELDSKNENVANLERKLRDVTEMHERTLTERAANLQEFNRALDHQRALREQRDTLTNATLLDQLSKAKEEIEHLKKERITQSLSDSMTQLRLGFGKELRDTKQSARIINNLEQRLLASERTIKKLEENISEIQHEKQLLINQIELAKPNVQSDEVDRLRCELNSVKELYLTVCREKDLLENNLEQVSAERNDLQENKKELLKDVQNLKICMEESLNQQKTVLEAQFNAKLNVAVQEQLACAQLEWQTKFLNGNQTLIDENSGELQGFQKLIETLRIERDVLQNELTKRQEQLKLERQMLREKFEIEKQMLNKAWQEKLAMVFSTPPENLEKHLSEKTLINATADAMARLRQQCEEEKLSIIASYEKQIVELQSSLSTPLASLAISNSLSEQTTFDWRLDLSKVKMFLKNNPQMICEALTSLDNAVLKVEALWQHDQKVIQEQSEKYKHLKRRVRDYQKHINEKLAKQRTDRQRSEDYCRYVISDLLARVTEELQLLEQDRCHNNHVDGVSNATQHAVDVSPMQPCDTFQSRASVSFAQGIEDLKQQVNRYVQGLTSMNKVNK